jgi:hypothetical protein
MLHIHFTTAAQPLHKPIATNGPTTTHHHLGEGQMAQTLL